MYCSKCGTKNEDNAKFCVKCRNPLGSLNDTTNTSSSSSVSSSNSWFYSVSDSLDGDNEGKKETVVPPTPPKSSYTSPTPPPKSSTSYVPVPPKKTSVTSSKGININNNLVKIIGVIAVIVVIVVGVMVSGITKPKCEKAVDKFMKSMLITYDAYDALDIFPEFFINSYGRNTLVKTLEKGCNELRNNAESENTEIAYKILGSEEVSSAELQSKKEYYSNTHNVIINDAKNVNVILSAEGRTETETVSIPMIKIDGSWYIDVQGGGWLGNITNSMPR